MNLYLDDDSVKASVAGVLRHAGHQVVLPADVGLAGASDARHLAQGAVQGFVVLTRDHKDFKDPHDLVQATHGQHEGILIVRFDNNAKRDMKDRDIARAIANPERAGMPIANGYTVLNHWR